MDKKFTNNEEWLMASLDDELDKNQQLQFKTQLSGDASLQLQYESLLLTKGAVQLYGLQQQVAGIHHQMMQELNRPVRTISPVKKIVRMVAAAAAVVLLFVAGYMFLGNNKIDVDKVFAANYTTYQLPVTRSADVEATLEKAYRNKDYSTVLQLVDNTTTTDAAPLFLSGVAAMELNKFDISITNFNKLLANNKATNSVYFNDDAEYYLGLAYFKIANYSMAYELLSKIAANKEHTYYLKVNKNLLTKIKKLLNN